MDPEDIFPDIDIGDGYQPTHDFVEVPYSQGLDVYKQILMFGILPVCFVGLTANTVSVYVWNSHRKHKSMVLLFQILGVLDNLFLLGTAVRGILVCADRMSAELEMYVLPGVLASHSMSVHVTVVIGVIRWWCVTTTTTTTTPHRAQGRRMRRKIVTACVGVGVWCVALTAVEVGMAGRLDVRGRGFLVKQVVLQLVAYVLPNLVLLAFSIALLRLTFRHQRHYSKEKHRKLTAAVVTIATMSFLACPVAVAGQLLGSLAPNNDPRVCHWVCAYTGFGLGELLQSATPFQTSATEGSSLVLLRLWQNHRLYHRIFWHPTLP
ncbi:hypothetical protein ACOMHN_056756 [Nucella lapillus]